MFFFQKLRETCENYVENVEIHMNSTFWANPQIVYFPDFQKSFLKMAQNVEISTFVATL